MKPLPISLDDPNSQPLVTMINDLVVNRLKDHTPEDQGFGDSLAATFGCRLQKEKSLYDPDGAVLSETLEYPKGDGTFVKWRLSYTWDDDQKIQDVRLTNPDGKVVGRWLARWEWVGSDSYGGEFELERWDFQQR